MSDSANDDTPSESRHVAYEACIVSFIDVLGFRDIIDTRPAAEVHNILLRLERFTRPESEPPPRSSDEIRLHSRAFAFSVSDAVVRARPYHTQSCDGAFFWELYDLLHAQISLVSSNVLIRGGVTVGNAHVGLRGEGPMFGPAMIRAYDIESKESIYPRIVIDSHALEQYRNDPYLRNEDNDVEEDIEAINSFITSGDDGTLFLDYIRASRSEYDDYESYFGFLSQHSALIRAGLSQERDLRTRRKYVWLARYHDRCVRELIAKAAASGARGLQNEEGLEIDVQAYLRNILVSDSEL
ncbi:hypothetical protein [Fodinicurvata sp. EGI_FJ10296]|uniref:hypothetical protein n=1 Tax=Fodinicurvata sp. EGI_FJ10296 TaxID=3231908 RepID=UPI0034530F2D